MADNLKKLFDKGFFVYFFVFLVSFLAIWPLFQGGFYPFHDETQIANLYQMTRAISGGQIPPRWAPDFSFGYGHPFFNFYYPLPFYFGSIFFFVFKLSLVWSLKSIFILSFIASGFSFFYLMRKFFNKFSSFCGTVIYLFTPYRAVDLYVRGALGEMFSFVFMPLVLGTVFELIKKRSPKAIFLFGFSLAGLILSHNLSAIVFLPFVFIFALVLIIKEKRKFSGAVSVALGGLFGLLISAYYWLPAVLEKKYLQSGTPFNPVDHFPFIKQLIFPSWGYGASVWGPGDGMSFQLGLVNLLLTISTFVLFVFFYKRIHKERKLLLIIFGFFILFCLFLMNIRSLFIWEILPLASWVQFPWRFLMLTTLFTSILIGFLEDFFPKRKIFIQTILVVLAIVLSIGYFRPEKVITADDDYYLKRFFADRTISGKSVFSEQYLNNSEDYLPLSIWTKERPVSLPESKIESFWSTLNFKKITPTYFSGTVQSESGAVVFFHNYYFPGWSAYLDEEKIAVKIAKPYGDMFVEVPPGEHRIDFKFQNTNIRKVSNFLSFISLTFFVFLLLYKYKGTVFKK